MPIVGLVVEPFHNLGIDVVDRHSHNSKLVEVINRMTCYI